MTRHMVRHLVSVIQNSIVFNKTVLLYNVKDEQFLLGWYTRLLYFQNKPEYFDSFSKLLKDDALLRESGT